MYGIAVWDWYDYKIEFTDGSVLWSSVTHAELNDTIEAAMKRALKVTNTIPSVINIIPDSEGY